MLLLLNNCEVLCAISLGRQALRITPGGLQSYDAGISENATKPTVSLLGDVIDNWDLGLPGRANQGDNSTYTHISMH